MRRTALLRSRRQMPHDHQSAKRRPFTVAHIWRTQMTGLLPARSPSFRATAAAILALAISFPTIAQIDRSGAATATHPLVQPTLVTPRAATRRPLILLAGGPYRLTLKLPVHGHSPAWSQVSIVGIERTASGLQMRDGRTGRMTGTVTADASGAVTIVIAGVPVSWRLTGSVTPDGAAGDALASETGASLQGSFTLVRSDPCPQGADANGQCY